jgi:hypothetical protein
MTRTDQSRVLADRAGIERALARHEERLSTQRGMFDRARLEGKIDGLKLALAFIEAPKSLGAEEREASS